MIVFSLILVFSITAADPCHKCEGVYLNLKNTKAAGSVKSFFHGYYSKIREKDSEGFYFKHQSNNAIMFKKENSWSVSIDGDRSRKGLKFFFYSTEFT
jgi:hypothetical protein